MNQEIESVHAFTGAYVLDALDVDEVDIFEHHLASCADCRDEVRSLRSAVLRLPASSAVAPPPELRGSVMAAIATVRPLPPLPEALAPVAQPEALAPAAPPEGSEPAAISPADAPPTEPASTVPDRVVDMADRRGDRRDGAARVSRWRLVSVAAAVVAALAVGWGVIRPLTIETGTETGEQTQEQHLAQLLAAPDLEIVEHDGDGARGTVLRSESLHAGAIVLHDLPTLADDEVFQAWTLADATPASAGFFSSTDGSATVLLEGDVDAADAIALTVEPHGGSEQPTTDPFFLVEVGSA